MFSSVKENFIYKILVQHKRKIVFLLCGSSIAAFFNILYPYLLKILIDTLSGERQPMLLSYFQDNTFLFLIFFVFFIGLVDVLDQIAPTFLNLIRYKFDFSIASTSEKILFDKLKTLDAGFLENPKNQNLLRSFFNLPQIINDVLGFATGNLQSIITLGMLLPIVAFLDIRIILILLLFVFIQTILLFYRIPIANKNRTQTEYIQTKISSLRWALFGKFDQILALNGTAKFLKKYYDLREKLFQVSYPMEKQIEKWRLSDWMLDTIPAWFTMIFIGFKILQGDLTIGDFTLILAYTRQIQNIFSTVPSTLDQWSQFSLDYTRIHFFLHLKPKYRILEPIHTRPINGDVSFQEVSFAYPTFDETEVYMLKEVIIQNKKQLAKKNRWKYENDEIKEWEEILSVNKNKPRFVLKNINMVWKAGEITALVGRNGAGKTTTTKLSLKNYTPTKGTVSIGGINLDYCDPSDVRTAVSIVNQDPVFFDSLTLEENLLLGVDKKPNTAAIMKTLKRLGVATLVEKHHKGLGVVVGEDFRCSAGQTQLFTIARVLFQDRPIILFDEGTNQLDPEHEATVMDILQEQKKKGKVVFIISHKITTAAKADHIYVIDGCKVYEEGTHQELLKKNGLYKKFWHLQVEKNMFE